MLQKCVDGAKLALAAVIIFTISQGQSETTVVAQSSDPSFLPRLALTDLQYVGGFRLPREAANGDSFSFGGRPMAFNPAGPSLFVGSRSGRLAEVAIPSLVNSGDANALAFAPYLQGFADPTEGHLSQIGAAPGLGALVVQNSRLYGTAWMYFDAGNEQRVSHYSHSLQLSQPSFAGWSQVWETGKAGYVSGYMSNIPPEWQGRLGGSALTGQCCIPIVSRTSFGPSGFAFDITKTGQSAIPAAPLLYYTGEHPTLGAWEGTNEWYGIATGMGGVAVIAGTRTVLFFGRNGTGPACYGTGTADQSLTGLPVGDGSSYCYDPTNPYKATHAYPYRYQIWAYDLNDFAAVNAGTKQPWELVPYGVWPIEFPISEREVNIGGVGYDPQRQLIYVAQLNADQDGYAYRPIIHAFQVNAPRADGTLPSTRDPLPTTVTSVTMLANLPAPQPIGTTVTFTAQPAGGVAPHQYKWLVSDGATSTVAVNWTTSNRFTWTPTVENANSQISVWVRSAGNAADVLEASTYLAFPVTAPTPTADPTTSAVTLTANRVAPQPPLTAITWTATPVGNANSHQYKWRVFDGTTWTVLASWSRANSFIWTPGAANGNYRVEVWVRGPGNNADAPEAAANKGFPISATSTTPAPAPGTTVTNVVLKSDKSSPQSVGSAVVFTAQAAGGGAPYQYQWWVFDGDQWTVATGWGSNSFRWSPNKASSKYEIAVRARSAGSTSEAGEATATMRFNVNNGNGPGKD